MAGTMNKGSLIKGTGGSGGGGSASFPIVVTSSGSSLPSASGYQEGDTFLNTSDKKIYKAELVNYSLASDITNVGSLDVSTNEISGFSTTKYLSSNRYDTSVNNINIHFKTGNDVTSDQTILSQGYGSSYSILTAVQFGNRKLKIDSTVVYSNLVANTEYNIEGHISLNSDDNYYYFYGTLKENGVVVTTISCVYSITTSSNTKYTYFGVFRYYNEYLNPFLGTIYGDTNFLGTILVANLSWDSGTSLTDKTEYADKTNGALYLYENSELLTIGGGSAPTVLTDQTSTSMALAGNTIYKWTSALTSLSFASAEVSDLETVLYFTTGGTISFTDSSSLKWGGDGSAPSLEANTIYCISIRNGLAEIDTFGTVS